jgi:peroxiredoxin
MRTGEPFPDFTLKSQHGESITLSSFRGRSNVGLVFFPFAFSRVCTGELCELRDNRGDLESLDAEVLAISCDHFFSLRAFAEQDKLTFSLLSDYWPHGEVSRRLGQFDEQAGCSARATMILDRDGVLRWHVRNAISDARKLSEYRQVLNGLS